MPVRNIIVQPYDKTWEQNFAQIESELQTALGKTALRIEHVGSTSVKEHHLYVCPESSPVIEKIYKEVLQDEK